MNRALSLFLVSLFVSVVASAAPIRTFVSSSGSDLNPCTVASPCATIAHAVLNTATGGEVVILTSGGYDGSFTIDHSLKIYPAPGVVASIIGSAGNAITVDGQGVIVTIKGLYITTNGAMGGISIKNAAQVFIDDVTVDGNGPIGGGGAAIFVGAGDVMVTHCRMRNTFRGVETNPIAFQNITVDHCLFEKMTGPAVHVSNSSRVTVRDSVLTHCYAAFNMGTLTSSMPELVVVNCLASYNQYGAIIGSGAMARFTRTTITNNGTGIQVAAGSTCFSYGNNEVSANGTNLVGVLTPVSMM